MTGLELCMDGGALGPGAHSVGDSWAGVALLPGASSPSAAPGGSVPVLRSRCVSPAWGPTWGWSDITSHTTGTKRGLQFTEHLQVSRYHGVPKLTSHARGY